MKAEGVRITAVAPGSPAAAAGLRAGDGILAVNGRRVADALDVAYAAAEEKFSLRLRRGARVRSLAVRRAPGQAWGARLAPPAPRRCGNRCLFCFVDQLPRGLRPSLYQKDEDYRHSFLYGNYITLTHFNHRDLERVRRLGLSPLFVSVHATEEEVRGRLLGRKGLPPLMPWLRRLAAAGVVLHTQAVVCPGINDGAVLERTVSDLSRLYPAVRSLALVPVGLTRHRRGLPRLRPVTPSAARAVLSRLAHWQARFRSRLGSRFVFATDEWYLLAREPLPPAGAYEGYPQIENGVGLTRQFLEQVRAACRRLPERINPPRRVLIPTGELAAATVSAALQPLRRVRGLTLRVLPVPNRLLGRRVTVTGLLCGADLLRALRPRVRGGERVLLARDMIRAGHDVFLDDLPVRAFARQLGVQVRRVRDPRGLIRSILR